MATKQTPNLTPEQRDHLDRLEASKARLAEILAKHERGEYKVPGVRRCNRDRVRPHSCPAGAGRGASRNF